jgi:hypothetical protein
MQENTGPWYKHFWPLFMFGLISMVVVASLTTVYIAIDGSDDLVNDNYYKDGLGINMQLEESALASQLNARAVASINDNAIALQLELDTNAPSQLIMQFSHPASDKFDQKVFLFPNPQGVYEGMVDLPAQRFYVQVKGAHNSQFWRLSGELTPNNGQQVTLQN